MSKLATVLAMLIDAFPVDPLVCVRIRFPRLNDYAWNQTRATKFEAPKLKKEPVNGYLPNVATKGT
ncbi:MAG: hypothetical protein WCI87_06345 [Euryarchaeota archaeon]